MYGLWHDVAKTDAAAVQAGGRQVFGVVQVASINDYPRRPLARQQDTLSDIGQCRCLYRANMARTRYVHVHIGVPRKGVERLRNKTVKGGIAQPWQTVSANRPVKSVIHTCEVVSQLPSTSCHSWVCRLFGLLPGLSKKAMDGRKAMKYKGCSGFSVSGMSHRFIDAARQSPTLFARLWRNAGVNNSR